MSREQEIEMELDEIAGDSVDQGGHGHIGIIDVVTYAVARGMEPKAARVFAAAWFKAKDIITRGFEVKRRREAECREAPRVEPTPAGPYR